MTHSPPSKTKSFMRSALTKLTYFVSVMLILVAAGEITARMMGYRPYQEVRQSIKITPEGRFYQADSLLGYKGKPGHFDLVLSDSLRFSVMHDSEGWRITAPDSVDRDSLQEIWIFGCSFTHGYGVNDDQNFPWLLQQAIPQYRIRNFGMDGYSTLHAWLLLQNLVADGKRPAAVILAHGAFHEQRNTANRYWHKALHGQQIAEDIRYPFLRFDENDSLRLQYSKLEYHLLPLQKQLALLALIEEEWNQSEEDGLRSSYITEVLIERINELCHKIKAKFILAGIYQHPQTSKMLEIFHLDQVATVDISQELSKPEMRILPGNGHPNAKAHALMADKLLHFLQQTDLFKETQIPQ
jgi:hypothetical protein